MTVAIVIPARFASTRLPEKMMLNRTGWTLIRHTYEQAKKAKLADRIVIATDDARIQAECEAFGAEVVMTDPDHPTGTDRLAEVATKYLPDVDFIVNVQGDEPELEPENIDRLIELFKAGRDMAVMGTLVTPFLAGKTEGVGSPLDPNCNKTLLGLPVKGKDGSVLGYDALYFSRSLVPYPRDAAGKVEDPTQYYLHLGIYAYTPEFLQRYVAMPQGKLEVTEKLEQLRVLENGLKIVAGIVPKASPGVDTQADYDAFVQRWNASK